MVVCRYTAESEGIGNEALKWRRCIYRMKTFSYVAKDTTGKTIKGTYEAENEQELLDFFSKLEKLTAHAGCDLVISYSDDPANVPECIRQYQI